MSEDRLLYAAVVVLVLITTPFAAVAQKPTAIDRNPAPSMTDSEKPDGTCKSASTSRSGGSKNSSRQLRCLDDRLVIAPAGPYLFSLEAGVGIGLFFTTHGRLSVSFGRRFWDRLEVEASFMVGVGEQLIPIESSIRSALLLHLSRRLDLLLGWRVGYALFHVTVPTGTLWTSSFVLAMVAGLKVAITPAWALRLTPIVATGYWNGVWGFTLEPGVGAAYRF